MIGLIASPLPSFCILGKRSLLFCQLNRSHRKQSELKRAALFATCITEWKEHRCFLIISAEGKSDAERMCRGDQHVGEERPCRWDPSLCFSGRWRALHLTYCTNAVKYILTALSKLNQTSINLLQACSFFCRAWKCESKVMFLHVARTCCLFGHRGVGELDAVLKCQSQLQTWLLYLCHMFLQRIGMIEPAQSFVLHMNTQASTYVPLRNTGMELWRVKHRTATTAEQGSEKVCLARACS